MRNSIILYRISLALKNISHLLENMSSALKIYGAVFRIGAAKSMEYRTNFVSNSFLWLVITAFVQVCLWSAVYGSSNLTVAGTSVSDMMLYVIAASVALSLTHSSKVERAAAEEIRNGDLNKYLLKPVSHLYYTFAASLADRAFGFIFIVVLSVSIGIPLTLNGTISVSIGAACISAGFVVIAVIIRFLMSMIISYLAFWMDETWTFHVVLDISLWFLSGMMLPMNILPPIFRQISETLPFQFLAYIPAGIISRRISTDFTWYFTLIGLSWIVLLYNLTIFVWKRGIVKFGAFGG
jgi:ABC-2 type transport system permease protein